MIIIILVCLGFGTSTHLTNAYGLAGIPVLNFLMTVATVMIVTTTLLTLVMYYVWGFVFIIPIAFLVFFGTIDGAFWGGIPLNQFP
jgi:KUP system potassium uptake protein